MCARANERASERASKPSERASERLRPRPLLNSSTSRSRGYTRPLLLWDKRGGPPVPRDTGEASILFPRWTGEQRSKPEIHSRIESFVPLRERARSQISADICCELLDRWLFCTPRDFYVPREFYFVQSCEDVEHNAYKTIFHRCSIFLTFQVILKN